MHQFGESFFGAAWSEPLLIRLARAENHPATIKSQPSETLLTGQNAVIDLTSVQGAARDETEFEIFVERSRGAGKEAGVTSFTFLSVVCADSTTATRSVNGSI